MAALQAATYARVQDHLSSEGTFLMGDAQVAGFPIRYASQGFEQLYGYKGSEIVGKKCGDLIGGPFLLSNPGALATAASVAELTPADTETRIRFLKEKAGEACRVMMANPDERVGVALLLNRKKSGVLFVCECLVLNLKHPSLSWSYCVGFQRDISKSVSTKALLDACSPTDYSRLLQSRASSLESRRAALLGVGSENVMRYLHEKALSVFSLDIWRSLRSEMLASAGASDSDAGALAEVPPGADMHAQQLSTRHPTAAVAHPAATGFYLPQQETLAQPPSALPLVFPQSQSQAQPPSALPLVFPQSQSQVELRRQLQANPAVAFLTNAGLGQYAEPLLLNGFDDLEALVEMTDEDMRSVGLMRGHAAKLKRRLRELKCLQICAGSDRPALPEQPQRPLSPAASVATSSEAEVHAKSLAEPAGKGMVPPPRRAAGLPTLLQQVHGTGARA